MKKIMMMSVALSMVAIAGVTHAADFNTLTTPTTSTSAPVTLAPAQATVTPKKAVSFKGARIVPDTAPAPVPATGTPLKKSDQGYSDMSAYNVVNDQNKPITNDWSRPKDWRIGYKNKNRTAVNE